MENRLEQEVAQEQEVEQMDTGSEEIVDAAAEDTT